jgi:hypothetical protein
MEDRYAEQARAILEEMGITPDNPPKRSRISTNSFNHPADPNAASRAEIAAVASRLAERLKEKDDKDDSIGGA